MLLGWDENPEWLARLNGYLRGLDFLLPRRKARLAHFILELSVDPVTNLY